MRRGARRCKSVFAFLAIFTLALAINHAHAQTLTTLYSFDSPGPIFPRNNLTLSGSTLYGMTLNGGPSGLGTVFSLPVTGGTPTTLGSFNNTNGAVPTGDLMLSGSTLYGMAYQGGANGDGTIFSVPATGGTVTDLLSFNGTNGENPNSGLTLSADGSTLYGMTWAGGANGVGAIISIPVTGGAPTTLASFGGAYDGSNGALPYGDLTLIGSTLYGMTSAGGANNAGTIFSIPVTGGTITNLASFNVTNGEQPEGSLTLIGSTFYGMTDGGGANDLGTIFSIPMTGGAITNLASFNGADGRDPLGNVTLVGSTLYGLTSYGGEIGSGPRGLGYGTLFSIPVTGGTPTALVAFNGTNGFFPTGGLTLVGSTLYGTTEFGGANGEGNVFALALTPEPSSVVLLGFGALGLGAMVLRRRMGQRAA